MESREIIESPPGIQASSNDEKSLSLNLVKDELLVEEINKLKTINETILLLIKYIDTRTKTLTELIENIEQQMPFIRVQDVSKRQTADVFFKRYIFTKIVKLHNDYLYIKQQAAVMFECYDVCDNECEDLNEKIYSSIDKHKELLKKICCRDNEEVKKLILETERWTLYADYFKEEYGVPYNWQSKAQHKLMLQSSNPALKEELERLKEQQVSLEANCKVMIEAFKKIEKKYNKQLKQLYPLGHPNHNLIIDLSEALNNFLKHYLLNENANSSLERLRKECEAVILQCQISRQMYFRCASSEALSLMHVANLENEEKKSHPGKKINKLALRAKKSKKEPHADFRTVPIPSIFVTKPLGMPPLEPATSQQLTQNSSTNFDVQASLSISTPVESRVGYPFEAPSGFLSLTVASPSSHDMVARSGLSFVRAFGQQSILPESTTQSSNSSANCAQKRKK